jgi:signal transduction histidine kinase
VERLRFQAEHVVATNRGYLLASGPSSLDRFEAAAHRLEESVQALRKRIDPAGAMLAADVENAASSYIEAAATAHRRTLGGSPQELHAYLEETLQPRREAFESTLAALVEHERARLHDEFVDSQTFAHRIGLGLLLATILVIAIGITLAVHAVRRLSQSYAQLLAAERAAHTAGVAREEVLAVVSHDLRTPLNSISLASTLLEDETSVDGKPHLRVIHNASDRMLHLVNQLLETHSLDVGQLSLAIHRCAVRPLFDDVIELFRSRASSLGIELRAEPSDEWVVGDRERLIEILSNLLSNALDHTPEGGRITLRTDRDEHDVRLVVADTGTGIPADELRNVFERNWRSPTQHRRSGFGLGLYICKRLVDAHSGTIGVHSVPGAGASFWFSLPVEGRRGK